MESKELPTAIDYIYHARNRDEIKDVPSPEKVAEWMHEYAVLFARHHLNEAKKEISNYIKNNAEIDNSDKEVDNMISNAYPLDNIR